MEKQKHPHPQLVLGLLVAFLIVGSAFAAPVRLSPCRTVSRT